MKIDQDWLLGTKCNSEKTVIVNRAKDDFLLERIQKEIYSSLMMCRNVNPRIRITIEVLDTDL